jgi:methylmalonyl-CoA mutase
MATIQGHTRSLPSNALDEALALPTGFSARIRPQRPIAAGPGDRHYEGDRSLGRQLLRGETDLRPGLPCLGPHPGSEERQWHGRAIDAGNSQAARRGGRARTQARIDSGRQPVIGVNEM